MSSSLMTGRKSGLWLFLDRNTTVSAPLHCDFFFFHPRLMSSLFPSSLTLPACSKTRALAVFSAKNHTDPVTCEVYSSVGPPPSQDLRPPPKIHQSGPGADVVHPRPNRHSRMLRSSLFLPGPFSSDRPRSLIAGIRQRQRLLWIRTRIPFFGLSCLLHKHIFFVLHRIFLLSFPPWNPHPLNAFYILASSMVPPLDLRSPLFADTVDSFLAFFFFFFCSRIPEAPSSHIGPVCRVLLPGLPQSTSQINCVFLFPPMRRCTTPLFRFQTPISSFTPVTS